MATKQHPIAELYTDTDFLTAVRHYREGVVFEIRLLMEGEDAATQRQINEQWKQPIAEAREAARIYADAHAAADQQAIVNLRAAGLGEWADALETGSYALLAF